MSIKDIRSKTVGAKNIFKTEKVEHEDITVEVRQLSYADRSALIDKCKDGDQIDSQKLQLMAVIYTVHDPESGEKVFSLDDYETMAQQPSGGYVDTFSKASFRVLGLSEDDSAAKK